MIEKIERPDEKKETHSIIIRDRNMIEISGVTGVDSFDEETIALKLADGRLIVEGRNLHIGELSLDSHRVTADGEIISLLYTDREEKIKGGLFRRRG